MKYEIGTRVLTKDGRRHGNGIIYSTLELDYHRDENNNIIPLYCVETDFGNTMKITEEELENQFYIAELAPHNATRQAELKEWYIGRHNNALRNIPF